MAIFNSYILGQVKKSIGNVTMYRAKKKNLARGKAISVRNPRTDLQVGHRSKFNRLVNLAGVFGGVILKGFQTRSLIDARNEFVKRNMALASLEDGANVAVDFERLSLSSGSLGAPAFTLSASENSGTLALTKREQVMMTGRQEPEDDVFAVLFEAEAEEAVLYDLGKRGETEMQEVAFPEQWNPESIYVYGFAVNAKRKAVSKTIFVGRGSGTGNN